MIEFSTMQYQQCDGHQVARMESTLIVLLDRPEKSNALDLETCAALSQTFDVFEADTSLRVAILGSQGRHFCAGMDLRMVQPGTRVALPATGFGGITNRWLPKPIIAAVQGAAFGGGFEIVLACDLVVADPTARFCLPEPRVGQAALAGGLQRLPQRVGAGLANDLALSCRELHLEEALSCGLVNRSAPVNQSLATAINLASELSKGAPLSLSATKAVLRKGEFGLSDQQTGALTEAMLDSEDAVEGARAFTCKRTPVWKSR